MTIRRTYPRVGSPSTGCRLRVCLGIGLNSGKTTYQGLSEVELLIAVSSNLDGKLIDISAVSPIYFRIIFWHSCFCKSIFLQFNLRNFSQSIQN